LKVKEKFKDTFGWDEFHLDKYASNYIMSSLFEYVMINRKGRGYNHFLSCIEVWKMNDVLNGRLINRDLVTIYQLKKLDKFISEKFKGL